ncbi:MAG TPA: SatD family protein [Gemmatimonadales bacterium]|nr:SatD family protein [Gemmatimonadales bacterium]
MTHRTFVALIADAVASRTLPAAARAQLQRDLRAALPRFNRRWHASLAARFAVTLGDELQCLLTTAAPVWEITQVVRAELDSVDWVMACARGPVNTTLHRGITAPEVDGPCFHDARAALEDAKQRGQLLAFRGFGATDVTLAGLASYYSALHWSWTPRQRRAAKWLRASDPARAAAELGVHRSAISHLARRMAWPLVSAGDSILRAQLDRTP